MKTHADGFRYLMFVCLVCPVARADIVFDNFGPNDTYEQSRGRSINWVVESPGSSLNMGLGSAARFHAPSGSYSLLSVTLALGSVYFGGTNNLAVSIRGDNDGSPTGSLLEAVVTHPADLIADHLVVTYQSSLNPVMVGGSYYWLVMEAADLNQVDGGNNAAFDWYGSGTLGYAGNREYNFDAADWNAWQIFPSTLIPAFRIEGTLVPEPGPLWMLLGGGLGWWMLRSRSRHAVKSTRDNQPRRRR